MKNKLINCLVAKTNIQITFSTKEQWDAYKENRTNLLAIKLKNDFNIGKDFQDAEKELDFVINGFNYKKAVVFAMALSFIIINRNITVHAATTIVGEEGLTKLGEKFVGLIQMAGYWICFAKGLIDIIKEVLKGGEKADGIAKILIKYTLAFSSFYLLPVLFDMIKGSFTIAT